jgi:hypothetical protein
MISIWYATATCEERRIDTGIESKIQDPQHTGKINMKSRTVLFWNSIKYRMIHLIAISNGVLYIAVTISIQYVVSAPRGRWRASTRYQSTRSSTLVSDYTAGVVFAAIQREEEIKKKTNYIQCSTVQHCTVQLIA